MYFTSAVKFFLFIFSLSVQTPFKSENSSRVRYSGSVILFTMLYANLKLYLSLYVNLFNFFISLPPSKVGKQNIAPELERG